MILNKEAGRQLSVPPPALHWQQYGPALGTPRPRNSPAVSHSCVPAVPLLPVPRLRSEPGIDALITTISTRPWS